MACLVFGQSSGVCAATIIFYTCIWIPFLEIKKLLLNIKGLVLHSEAEGKWWWAADDAADANAGAGADADLPVARFQGLDLALDGSRSSSAAAEDEETLMTCWVCLVKMKGEEEVVSRLRRCGHVFHTRCIQSWIRLCCRPHHFTCPLCRTSLFFLHRHQSPSTAAPAHHLPVPSHG
ncbi:RING-H2 finger protein ATL18 [Diospyros lotus]|uniref:RING-H2 finger protein ATL18 n=1 Tax=Diospyros lotus TaxID=55363 RepID=UPI002258D46E|nr:RING-H2 finger protein ATL18 [Diospyros lotus]